MITISLNQIKAKDPCEEGWKTIVKARGGKDADYDEQFPLSAAYAAVIDAARAAWSALAARAALAAAKVASQKQYTMIQK